MFQPKDEVYAAAVVAPEQLTDDWLNDAVKGASCPATTHRPAPVFETDSLRVDVASPQYLLR